MENIILVVIVIAIIAFAGLYIYRAKKKGRKCIGCPYSDNCKSGSCNCNK